MKIKKKEHYSELKFRDSYGKVTIRIQKDLSQLTLESDNGDTFTDTDREVLTGLRNLLNKMLE